MRDKIIFDNIHQFIKIKSIAQIIIDTPEFQRLRNISQLGTCQYIFPCGNHSRFEHSIGTYFLTNKILKSIKRNSCDKVKKILTDRTIELIKIGGLCHDLGHGPYSHVFDDLILEDITNINKYHEIRSGLLVEQIILKYVNNHDYIIKNNLLITNEEIEFIKNIINPKKENTSFIYQIVSNNLNSIDVDKFDYIKRDARNVGLTQEFDYSRMIEEVKVINNKICYPQQTYLHLCSLFTTRYYLHKQIYNHKAVKSIEYMIYDIIKLLDTKINLINSIDDMNKFIIYDDNYFFNYIDIMLHNDININRNLVKAKQLVNRIRTRQLYKFVGEIINKDKITLIWEDFNKLDSRIKENDIIISKVIIGFISGNKSNPLDSIYLYNKKNDNKCFKIKKENISNLLPNNYQECCIKIFCKNNNKYEIIKKVFNQMVSYKKNQVYQI
jgi:HD superfamily phosphohydrolase